MKASEAIWKNVGASKIDAGVMNMFGMMSIGAWVSNVRMKKVFADSIALVTLRSGSGSDKRRELMIARRVTQRYADARVPLSVIRLHLS